MTSIKDIAKACAAVENGLIDKKTFTKILADYLSDDDKIFDSLLAVVAARREIDKELITDSNLELSRALVHIQSPKAVQKDFTVQNIKGHYLKWKDKIRCCFKIEGLP